MNRYDGSIEEDRRLIYECVSGNRNASEVFVRRFSNLVYRAVLYTLRTRHIAYHSQDLEDLHNTIFLKLLEQDCKKLRQYEGRNGCSLASWLRIVSVRIVLNHIRKKGLDAMLWQKKRVSLDEMLEVRGDGEESWVLMDRAEQERMVQDGIRNLSTRDRLFMKLHFDEGLPVEEVASALQISVENVYTIKHRAIQRLKSYVSAEKK